MGGTLYVNRMHGRKYMYNLVCFVVTELSHITSLLLLTYLVGRIVSLDAGNNGTGEGPTCDIQVECNSIKSMQGHLLNQPV
jgi:hypothetical protein